MIETPIIVLSIYLICWSICKILGKDDSAKEIEQAAENYQKSGGCGCGCFTWLFIILIGGAIITMFRV